MMDSSYESLLDVCVNSAMAQLRGMTTDQLEQILNNDARINSLIETLPQVRSLPSEREVGLTENKTLAEWNLGQEDRIEKLRAEVLRNHEKSTTLKREVDTLKAKLDGSSANQSLDVTGNLLQVAAQDAEDEAETLAGDFYNGKIIVDVFLKQFHEKKTLSHIRKIKCDRLLNILHDQQYSQVTNRISMPNAPSGYGTPTNVNRHSFF